MERTDQPTPQPTPRTWTDLTYANAVADCPTHRAQHEQAEKAHAEFQAANSASIARRDRRTLGLQTAGRPLPRQAAGA